MKISYPSAMTRGGARESRNQITDMLISIVVAQLVIPQRSDHVIFHRIASYVRSPRQLLPASQALARQTTLRHRIVHREQRLQRLGQFSTGCA